MVAKHDRRETTSSRKKINYILYTMLIDLGWFPCRIMMVKIFLSIKEGLSTVLGLKRFFSFFYVCEHVNKSQVFASCRFESCFPFLYTLKILQTLNPSSCIITYLWRSSLLQIISNISIDFHHHFFWKAVLILIISMINKAYFFYFVALTMLSLPSCLILCFKWEFSKLLVANEVLHALCICCIHHET